MKEARLRFRFQHYLEKKEGGRVLWMRRDDWESLQPEFGNPVQLDVSSTPLSKVSSDASVMAVVATRESSQTAQVDVYRHDPKDKPTPVNKDTYVVLKDIPRRPDYQHLISAASTGDTPELRGFLAENVGFVKVNLIAGHWSEALPTGVVTILQASTKTGPCG